MVASKNTSTVKARKSSDRHLKVNGRDRRIRLPLKCANRVFDLMNSLGHRTAGQTIEWLLYQAQSAVSAILSGNAPQPLQAGAVTSIPLASNGLQVQPKLVRPKEKPNMSPVHSPVTLGPSFMCGAEPEYTPVEMAWVMFQASIANQHV